MKRAVTVVGQFLGLVSLYVVLFIVGTKLFPVRMGPPPDPKETAQALLGMLACAVIDTALLGLWASRTRLRGWRRWAAFAASFYGVKTFSSQLEALWFMPNVTSTMAPALFAMTLPLCVLFPVAVIAAFGSRGPAPEPAWRAPVVPRAWAMADWSALSIVVYPALFWSAGYFVAFQSPAVTAFYGGLQGDGFFGHLWGVFSRDPAVVAFEAFRGLLWILLVLPLFRTSQGRWWSDALLVGATLALVQNDVHFLPNPLMTPEIRLYHFIETASSNFVWGFSIVALLRGWRERAASLGAPAARGPRPDPRLTEARS
jgi:hypothetical protein